jgi:ABC-type Mn2+/Zn2+ transport system ATPase subunit
VSEPSLVLRARRLRAARGVVVARDVSLTAAPGDVVSVEGPNGSGKTTLLAAAAGLLPAGTASVRPGSVGYAPERAGSLPRIGLQQWLAGLARTSGLTRSESARCTGDLLSRLGLAHTSAVPLQALSRGNAQRALVAQALIAEPDLLILDEPTGGLDDDGVARVVAEIERAASRRAVVLVARHPTALLPLPPGMTWRFRDGRVDELPREAGDGPPLVAEGTMEVETGDGMIQRVDEAGLPGVLRAALDAGLAVWRVQPVQAPHGGSASRAAPVTAATGPGGPGTAGHAGAAAPGLTAEARPRRAGPVLRLLYGAGHRARLLASSQWFLAPGMLFLLTLAVVYATAAGPALQAAAFTAIALVPVMTWLGVLAHRVDGRELGRAFAAHAGGRARAHLATDLGLAPFAAALVAVAVIWPLVTQGSQPHPPSLDLKIVELHLAAALFGAGLGSILALIERAGWRLITAVALLLALFVIRPTPLSPLLRMSTHPSTVLTPVGDQVAWLCLPGLLLAAAAAAIVTRLT